METIEFVQKFSNEEANIIDPTKAGMPSDFPMDIRTIVTFTTLEDSKTEMIVTEYAEFGTISNFAQIGLEQSMEKMVAIFS